MAGEIEEIWANRPALMASRLGPIGTYILASKPRHLTQTHRLTATRGRMVGKPEAIAATA
jgi:hypothetical protein